MSERYIGECIKMPFVMKPSSYFDRHPAISCYVAASAFHLYCNFALDIEAIITRYVITYKYTYVHIRQSILSGQL